MKRKPLRRFSTKKLAEMKEEKQKKYDFLTLFMRVWQRMPPRCQSCGAYLGDEPKTIFFDHLLDKEKYPELAYDEDNIYLCCWDCHSKKTNGHPTEKHKEAILIYKQNIGI